MKWVLIAVGALVLLVAVLMLIGSRVPREHRATVRATFKVDAESLFAVLTDVERYGSWRPGVESRRIDPIEGRPAFIETTRHGTVRYAVDASDPPRRLVLRIADDALPYGGTWTFALTPSGSGTTLAITEDGFIKTPLFRVMARFLFGYHATLEQYLASLAQKLGETVAIERVE